MGEEEQERKLSEVNASSWEDLANSVTSKAGSTFSSYFLRLLELEMVARTVRHSLSALLRDNRGRSGPGGTGAALAPGAIIATYMRHLLSCQEDNNEESGNH